MTSHLLPVEEWPRLAGTELETVWPHCDPSKCQILVVEHNGQIVACWARLIVTHLEGLYIAPEFRKSASAARCLLTGMRELVSGERAVFTSALTPDVEGLIDHFGGSELPGRHFVLEMS